MSKWCAARICIASLVMGLSCDRSDQEAAKRREAEAKEKAPAAATRIRREARKLGDETKAEGRALNAKIRQAVNGTGSEDGSSTSEAEAKLRRGTEDLKAASHEAGAKLGHAAMIARVKAKLANDVGLATVTSIDVDATGEVVTLRGTASSVQQKELAEKAALQVAGVRRVVNDLQVNQ